jgi:hypothetical protein
MENTNKDPQFGFNIFSETWNGRLAMLGFVIGLATELLTGQGILQQLGIMLIGGLSFSPLLHLSILAISNCRIRFFDRF